MFASVLVSSFLEGQDVLVCPAALALGVLEGSWKEVPAGYSDLLSNSL